MNERSRSPRGRFGPDVRNIIGSSAGPYGYTLCIWGSGSSLSAIYDTPTVPQVFAFLSGAVIAFALISTLFYGGVTKEFGSPSNKTELWGSFHFLSVGLAIGAVCLVASLVPVATIGWLLGSAIATTVYLVVVGAQHSAADVTTRSSEEDAADA